MEEGKRKGYLATSRQYGNTLMLGVRHQEEEEGSTVRIQESEFRNPDSLDYRKST